ncbi:hypothetical protein ACFWG6_30775 [Streptomyces erythrochromogenes]|uniref:hypothetical protein n=1 Tax=Streptomyces erythrochromogenes TaxID=285574 RepID=UPI00364283C1
MRVQLTVTIELNEAQMREYADEYGLRATAASVGKDVAENIETGLQSSLIADFATLKVARTGR